jgi:hypothetical protein
MPDYSKSQIYTIRNRNDNTKIYVGSTIQPLHKRFYEHKIKSKNEKFMNRLLYKEVNNDWNNWYIELYEIYSCNNKNELLKKEGEIIRLIGTLNKIISGRDKKQYNIDNADKLKEDKKLYYIDNKDKIKEYKLQYDIDNADKLKEKAKQYYIDNIEKKQEQFKQYYIDNKDKFKEQNKQYQINNKDKLKEYNRQYYLKKLNEKLSI